jgi:NADH:ubiquinone oxidoreductase subunit K
MRRGASNLHQVVPMAVGFAVAILAVLAFVHFLSKIPPFVISLLVIAVAAAIPFAIIFKLYQTFFPKSLPSDPLQQVVGDYPYSEHLSNPSHGGNTNEEEFNCLTRKKVSSLNVHR